MQSIFLGIPSLGQDSIHTNHSSNIYIIFLKNASSPSIMREFLMQTKYAQPVSEKRDPKTE
jgi:hypothetical protein